MNILLSYSAKQDSQAVANGYKFLGVAEGVYGFEVHVFEIIPVEEHNKLHRRINENTYNRQRLIY